MEFRKATLEELNKIMGIINEAKIVLKNLGLDQWQNGYPNENTIIQDIQNKESYVLVKDGEIVGTAMLSFLGEPNYKVIVEGQWLSDAPYATIHRVAVSSKHQGQGLSGSIMKEIEKLCMENQFASVRIDTHKGNLPMQRAMLKNGFTYCGIIYTEDKNERIAFEKMLL